MKRSLLLLCLSIQFWINAQGNKPKLSDYKKNAYSQFGEDGIVEKIFEIIGTTSKIAIEFGAADGFSCSNTANLWTRDCGWSSILIEANPELYKKVVANVAPYNCKAINKAVGTTSSDSLEAILEQEKINTASIDLLSIDIDGNDYYVFQSLNNLRARVIICEYNPSIPAHLDIYPAYNNHIGCSVAALVRVAAQKNYTLIAITDANCFFIRNEELNKFADFDIEFEHMRIDRYLAYIISDYKSGYKIIGPENFTDAWGWAGTKSNQVLNGSYTSIGGTIQRHS